MRFTGKIKFHGGKSQDFSENHLQKKRDVAHYKCDRM